MEPSVQISIAAHVNSNDPSLQDGKLNAGLNLVGDRVMLSVQKGTDKFRFSVDIRELHFLVYALKGFAEVYLGLDGDKYIPPISDESDEEGSVDLSGLGW